MYVLFDPKAKVDTSKNVKTRNPLTPLRIFEQLDLPLPYILSYQIYPLPQG